MMNQNELRELSRQIRAKRLHADDDVINRMTADIEDYRAVLARQASQLPPAPLDTLLPLMGWLIYETSWDAVQRVDASFDREGADPQTRRDSEAEVARVARIVDCARRLPWPEFAPRAIGAFRALALAESKRDTQPGYDAAWILHEEARTRYAEYRDSHGDAEEGRDFVRGLDEVFLQLALAETGTACRTAERVIARWSEDDELGNRTLVDEQRWVQRIFRELTAGVAVGERAIDVGERIRDTVGFVDTVDEHRMTRRSALQNPGIMTARAASLLLPIRAAMQDLGRAHPPEFDSWQLWEDDLIRRFHRAYQAIESEVTGADGAPVPMDPGFQRQLVHVRLNLALLKPGHDLPSRQAEPLPCVALNPLDDTAVEAMSEWLAGPEGRGRERALGAATMPIFIRSLIACRNLGPDDTGYQAWRLRWFRLDHYADESGRFERVKEALHRAIA